MIKIKAIFRGADGSLGYRTGRIYELYFYTHVGKIIIRHQTFEIRGRCPYNSLKLFLDNWEVMS
jgi:hypothetical protein